MIIHTELHAVFTAKDSAFWQLLTEGQLSRIIESVSSQRWLFQRPIVFFGYGHVLICPSFCDDLLNIPAACTIRLGPLKNQAPGLSTTGAVLCPSSQIKEPKTYPILLPSVLGVSRTVNPEHSSAMHSSFDIFVGRNLKKTRKMLI